MTEKQIVARMLVSNGVGVVEVREREVTYRTSSMSIASVEFRFDEDGVFESLAWRRGFAAECRDEAAAAIRVERLEALCEAAGVSPSAIRMVVEGNFEPTVALRVFA